MNVHLGGGSPLVHPQQYQTTPLAVISQAEQQDRYLKQSELNRLASYFSSGSKLLEIAEILNQNADAIVAAGGDRIFYGGNPMKYLEKPQEMLDLPGYGKPVTMVGAAVAKANAAKKKEKLRQPNTASPPRRSGLVEFLQEIVYRMQLGGGEPLPGGFRPINISRYGAARMKRSMRDLAWFLRYITYAIVAGDESILSVNARGLRGVIPEDVTVATVVALKTMCRKSLSYFSEDEEAIDIVRYYFDVLIREYEVEKPSTRIRQGVDNNQQGLQLPQSYFLAAESKPKFVIKPHMSISEQRGVIKAAYRQIFEDDLQRTYGIAFKELESQLMGGKISMKEFVRSLGKSRLYLRLFYEPYTISRVIELAFRHFLGRGLSSPEEFQDYFAIISRGGLPGLIDALVDSTEYADYFGEETVPYLRGLGQEAQECRNWGAQLNLFKYSASVRKVAQFATLFGNYQQPLPNHHPYGIGNDSLETQFGAVFPSETRNPYTQPAPFGKDNHRLLISSSLGSQNTSNSVHSKEKTFKLDGVTHNRNNVDLSHHAVERLIDRAYRQVWGREPYSGQNLTSAETKLKGGEITVREFVRQLAKSNWFRDLHWDKLYVTKAIEAIHRRLLGRPTYGRSEMNQYYDLCAQKGFYALVDTILDSDEYLEAFGEDTVPYQRYLTPRGWAMRSLSQPTNWSQAQLDRNTTAGQVVAQKIREDSERLARLAKETNGSAANKTIDVAMAIEPATPSPEPASVANSNSNEAKPQTELPSVPENYPELETYEYSQTSDS